MDDSARATEREGRSPLYSLRRSGVLTEASLKVLAQVGVKEARELVGCTGGSIGPLDLIHGPGCQHEITGKRWRHRPDDICVHFCMTGDRLGQVFVDSMDCIPFIPAYVASALAEEVMTTWGVGGGHHEHRDDDHSAVCRFCRGRYVVRRVRDYLLEFGNDIPGYNAIHGDWGTEPEEMLACLIPLTWRVEEGLESHATHLMNRILKGASIYFNKLEGKDPPDRNYHHPHQTVIEIMQRVTLERVLEGIKHGQ